MEVQLVKPHAMSKFIYLTHVNSIFFLLSTLYISLFNATLVFRLFIAQFWKSSNKSSCQGTMIVLRWMWKLVQRLTKVYLVFCRIKIYPKSFINWVILLDERNIYYISCLIDPCMCLLKFFLISMLLNQFIKRYV